MLHYYLLRLKRHSPNQFKGTVATIRGSSDMAPSREKVTKVSGVCQYSTITDNERAKIFAEPGKEIKSSFASFDSACQPVGPPRSLRQDVAYYDREQISAILCARLPLPDCEAGAVSLAGA